MTPFGSLIAEFAAATGLELSVDARDSCTLVSDQLALTLQYCPDGDEVALFAPVVELDDDGPLPVAVLRKALALAYDGRGTRGAFLGLLGDGLVLSLRLPFEGLDVATLAVRVTAFADAAEAVAVELAAAAVAPPEADGEASAISPASDLLRV